MEVDDQAVVLAVLAPRMSQQVSLDREMIAEAKLVVKL
jgi:hypothetical protein